MRFIKILLVAALGVACVSTGTASAADVPHAPWGYQGGALSGAGHPMSLGPAPQSVPPGVKMGYLGGPVVSHASIESVYWGNGTYHDGTGPGETPITEFFQGVTDSPHMDWLNEYDTTSHVRLFDLPAQTIGRGTYQGQATIAPSSSSTSIDDSDIADELVRQIDAGALPPPQIDANGQTQTVYAMFFPETMTISAGTMVGGETNGFCAYHSVTFRGDVAVPYMVLPDFDSHHFADGCGDEPVLFDNFTSVTAHEIVETITDPVPGLGWVDVATGEEVADICGQQHGTVLGGNGVTHVVSLEYSKVLNDCIVSRAGLPAPSRNGYVNACALASRTGFTDAGLAGDCLKAYGLSVGKDGGTTFGENDGLVRSQVSSFLARLIELSGGALSNTRHFDDVKLANLQGQQEIEQLAGAGIIAGFPDGLFHPNDRLSVAQAATLLMRTLAFIHAPGFTDNGSTSANYFESVASGVLNPYASNLRGFTYAMNATDGTDRGLLADMLAQGIQRLADAGVVSRV